MEGAGSVTLIFRQLEKRWSDEHALNIVAAVATNSNFSHVEIAIGAHTAPPNGWTLPLSLPPSSSSTFPVS